MYQNPSIAQSALSCTRHLNEFVVHSSGKILLGLGFLGAIVANIACGDSGALLSSGFVSAFLGSNFLKKDKADDFTSIKDLFVISLWLTAGLIGANLVYKPIHTFILEEIYPLPILEHSVVSFGSSQLQNKSFVVSGIKGIKKIVFQPSGQATIILPAPENAAQTAEEHKLVHWNFLSDTLCIDGTECLKIIPDSGALTTPDGSIYGYIEKVGNVSQTFSDAHSITDQLLKAASQKPEQVAQRWGMNVEPQPLSDNSLMQWACGSAPPGTAGGVSCVLSPLNSASSGQSSQLIGGGNNIVIGSSNIDNYNAHYSPLGTNTILGNKANENLKQPQ